MEGLVAGASSSREPERGQPREQNRDACSGTQRGASKGSGILTLLPEEHTLRKKSRNDASNEGLNSATFVRIVEKDREGEDDDARLERAAGISKAVLHRHRDTTAPRKGRADHTAAPLYFFGGASDLKIFPQINRLLNLDETKMSSYLSNSATPTTAREAARGESIAGVDFQWPSLQTQRMLVDVYFKHFNRHYPVINEVVLRSLMAQEGDWKAVEMNNAMLALGIFSTATRYLSLEELTRNAELPAQGARWSNILQELMENWPTPATASTSYIQTMILSIYCKYGIECDSAHF